MIESIFDSPVALCQWMWPEAFFWSKSRDMLMAARNSAETYVAAGNELSKDWTMGRLAVSFVVSPWTYYPREHFDYLERRTDIPHASPEFVRHQRRCLTTSVKDKHLDVLWGEIKMAWQTCRPGVLDPFVMTHHMIRFKKDAEDLKNAASYVIGVVSGSENMEGLSGHHAPYTLGIGDEASGLDDAAKHAISKWCKRQVYIGNTWPCHNFFKREFEAGDLPISAADDPLLARSMKP